MINPTHHTSPHLEPNPDDAAEITITHSHAEGTLVEGTSRGDGTAALMKQFRLRWSRNLEQWYVPRSRDRAADRRRILALAEQLADTGHDVEVSIDDTPRTTQIVEEAVRERQDARAEALDDKAARYADRADAAWQRHDRDVKSLTPLGEAI